MIPSPQPFQTDPTMHPLKRRYEPVLLDRYPPKVAVNDIQKRDPFPDYVPMFAFPNDVNVVSADERPRSTWHGFAMTNADGSKLYGITLIVLASHSTQARPKSLSGAAKSGEEPTWLRKNESWLGA